MNLKDGSYAFLESSSSDGLGLTVHDVESFLLLMAKEGRTEPDSVNVREVQRLLQNITMELEPWGDIKLGIHVMEASEAKSILLSFDQK